MLYVQTELASEKRRLWTVGVQESYATYRFTICRIATSHSAMNIEMDSILVTWQSGTA